MDFNKYRQTAQEIENDFIENGRSYEDALNKIVIDVFDEMEEDYRKEQSKQLIITDVSQQRELLLDFLSKVNGNLITHPHLQMNSDFVDEYLKSINCG